MFDKYKKYKTAGIVVILVCIAIFLAANIRISTVKSHDREKENKNVDNFAQETVLGGYQADAGAGESEGDIISDSKAADKDIPDSGDGTDISDNDSKSQVGGSTSEGLQTEQDEHNSHIGGESNDHIEENTENQNSQNQNEESDNANNQNTDDKNDNTQEKYITCTIEIRCDSAVKKLDEITNPGIVQYIPKDGTILKKISYKVKEGTSVYELLATAASDNNIPIAASYDKSYVMSINNLAEKMIGKWSGWMYSVNSLPPQISANKYILKENDNVLWYYVCS